MKSNLPTDETNDSLALLNEANKKALDQESLELLNQLIVANDTQKVTDLTYLFNINQKKKTMARLNKMGELLDTIADTAIERFAKRPDELSNAEMLQAIRVVQGALDSEQKILGGTSSDTPLIQINQQNNGINVTESSGLTRESRDRVKNAVMDILAGLTTAVPNEEQIIEVVPEEEKK